MTGRRRGHGDLEHEILAVLAAGDTALTPAEVRQRLDAELAYSTVTTVLGRLFEKGQATREPAGRAFAYRAVREHTQVTAYQMHRLLDSEPDRTAVLTRFVDTLSRDDEALLAQLIRPAEPEPPR